MRHAKSDWEADFGSDHERPLNKRGTQSARLMGRVLAGQALTPDLVISSTAVRARSTAELAIEAGGWGCPLQLDRSLYDSGAKTVLSTAAGAPDVGSLMLVGHQPTWSMLVWELTGARVEMKTATVAVVGLDVEDWHDLEGADGSLISVLNPGTFLGSEYDRPD
jgi:phosphohistidine phosphatase